MQDSYTLPCTWDSGGGGEVECHQPQAQASPRLRHQDHPDRLRGQDGNSLGPCPPTIPPSRLPREGAPSCALAPLSSALAIRPPELSAPPKEASIPS